MKFLETEQCRLLMALAERANPNNIWWWVGDSKLFDSKQGADHVHRVRCTICNAAIVFGQLDNHGWQHLNKSGLLPFI